MNNRCEQTLSGLLYFDILKTLCKYVNILKLLTNLTKQSQKQVATSDKKFFKINWNSL